jgi:hypothetical protein
MMRIFTAHDVDMQIHTQLVDEPSKKLVRQVGVEVTDTPRAYLDVIKEIRAATEIDDNFSQRFVERAGRLAEAANAVLVAEGVLESLTQRQADVFDRVMVVDFKIAFRVDIDVEKTMTAKAIQHVVQERHAGLNSCLTAAVDI